MTVFKKIIERTLPAEILYEDDFCLAFKDIAPQAPIHVLLVPKKEIVSLNEVSSKDKDLLGHLLSKVPEIAKLLGMTHKGYRVVINTGEGAGQTVFHLHLHIMGGKSFHTL